MSARWNLLVVLGLVGCASPPVAGDVWLLDDDDSTAGDTEWVVDTIHSEGGLQARVALTSFGPVVAHWAGASAQDGTCDELEVDPPRRMRRSLLLSVRGDASWTTHEVDAPVVAFTPTGLDLAVDPLGRPVLAYTGGEPEGQHCGAGDAVLATWDGDGFLRETAASDSGSSNTGMPASDAGFVVGYWPSVAFGPDGHPAVLHKDVHFGTLQNDDLHRADAEIAIQSFGGWSHQAVDPGEGAGDSGRLLFDADGTPWAIYGIGVDAQGGSRRGVWVARPDGDAGWQRAQIHVGSMQGPVAAAWLPAGGLAVAFYSPDDQAVRLRELDVLADALDEGAWTSELVGRGTFDEGRSPAMAFGPEGQMALAYRRCRRATSSAGCEPNDDAAIFAWRDESGAWLDEIVEPGGAGSCGEDTSLAIDADGTAWVAFRCTVQEAGEFLVRPMVASRQVWP